MSPRTFEIGFLALSAIGFVLLWPMMIYNGTLVGLLKAAWNGSFADGDTLLIKYTYVWPVDFTISVLVAFFDGQIDGRDNGTWMLMLDLLAVLQTATLWVTVEGSRKGNSKTILRLFAIWPLLWNMFGAAFILSLYFYYHTRITKSSASDPTLHITRARALIPTMILSAFPPAIIMMLAYDFTSPAGRQAIIAVFQFSPLVVGATAFILTVIISDHSRTNQTLDDISYVQYSYIFGGILSTSTHIYTMYITILSNDASVSFGRVFIPRPWEVHSGSVRNIHDGALLFLQYDWIIINLCCALWAYLVFSKNQYLAVTQASAFQAIAVILSTLIVGPAGTVCFALWLSEADLRMKYVKADAVREKM